MDEARTQHELAVTPDNAGSRLDVFVSTLLPELSRSRVQKLIQAGNILVNGIVQPAKYILRTPDQVLIKLPPPQSATPEPENIALDVLFEDEHLLVLNKPPGLVVHPGAGTPSGTLVNALLGRAGSVSSIGGVERPGIVHRLDKDTSGLMVVAKTDATHTALSLALADRQVRRTYHAIALRSFATLRGSIDAPIGRHVTQRTKMAVHSRNGSREAVTHWRVIESFHGMALVECRLETGRTHQIRVHLAHEKHPVLGDEAYGGSVSLALQLAHTRSAQLRSELKLVKRQMLHARQLKFLHPITNQEMEFEADVPEDFSRVLRALRQDVKTA